MSIMLFNNEILSDHHATAYSQPELFIWKLCYPDRIFRNGTPEEISKVSKVPDKQGLNVLRQEFHIERRILVIL